MGFRVILLILILAMNGFFAAAEVSLVSGYGHTLIRFRHCGIDHV